MSVIVVFLAVIAVIAGWWLSQQQLMAKPWLNVNSIGDIPARNEPSVPLAQVGLGVFLVVAGCLFALLVSAYFMRVEIGPSNGVVLRSMPIPAMLWVNTGVLVLSSIALQCADIAVRRGQRDVMRDALLLGAVSALVFLAGQILVWWQLVDAGYFAAGNPANAFFYLLTGMHGLHVAGGLIAIGRTVAKVWHDMPTARLRVSVRLCTIYWHFLLLIWLIVLALLTGWADDAIVICRAWVI